MSIETPSVGAAAVAGTSGAATVLSMLSEVATQILGVPLPVVLSATTGAWVARSYAPSKNFAAAIAGTLGWTIAGCTLAPLAGALLEHWTGLKLPTNALAGLALVVSGGLPLLLPILVEKVPEIVRARLDKWKGAP